MGMEMRQELKLSQQLVMTPQLQQAIRLLQLSRMELADLVHEEMLENPILDDELEGRAYRPAAERVRGPASWALPARFPPYAVAVPPAVTATAAGAAALATLAAAEHLELTGVFAACAELGVPVAAALGVANRVGPEAHVEWRARHAAVSRSLIEALRAERVL